MKALRRPVIWWIVVLGGIAAASVLISSPNAGLYGWFVLVVAWVGLAWLTNPRY